MSLISVIAGSRRRFDPDALAYFSGITAAGSSITDSNKLAVDAFVKGCKSDGIWGAIKASCLLAGPDTLAGALVPLVGPAPSNDGGLFTDSDYDRTSGLIGDGATKSIDSNYAFTSGLQNNKHVSLYVDTVDSSKLNAYCGSPELINSGNARTQIIVVDTTPTRISTRCSNSTTSTSPSTNNNNVAGFMGVNRSSSDSYLRRANAVTESVTATSATGAEANMAIFKRNTSAPIYTSARISFYSIGEQLDLALLDARVSTYMDSLT